MRGLKRTFKQAGRFVGSLAVGFLCFTASVVCRDAMAGSNPAVMNMPLISDFQVNLGAPDAITLTGKQSRSILVTLYGNAAGESGQCGIAYLYKNNLSERSHRICPPPGAALGHYEAVFQPEIDPNDGETIEWRAYFLLEGKITPSATAVSRLSRLP